MELAENAEQTFSFREMHGCCWWRAVLPQHYREAANRFPRKRIR
jgi:hypothetical protein